MDSSISAQRTNTGKRDALRESQARNPLSLLRPFNPGEYSPTGQAEHQIVSQVPTRKLSHVKFNEWKDKQRNTFI